MFHECHVLYFDICQSCFCLGKVLNCFVASSSKKATPIFKFCVIFLFIFKLAAPSISKIFPVFNFLQLEVFRLHIPMCIKNEWKCLLIEYTFKHSAYCPGAHLYSDQKQKNHLVDFRSRLDWSNRNNDFCILEPVRYISSASAFAIFSHSILYG